MRLAIIGSRTFSDEALAIETFKRHFCEFNESTQERTADEYLSHYDEIVSGGASGADQIGAAIARKWRLKLTEYLPDWKTHGKKAGFIRNEDIIKNSDMVLAFWDGQSRGTANSLSIAKRLKKPTLIIYF